VTARANETAGGYSVTATAGGASSALFSLTNTQPLGSPGPISTAAPLPTPGSTTTAHDVVIEFYNLASLRAAIADANSHPGPDTIIFDPAEFGTKRRTIRLVGGPLVITNPATTTIIGPGARLLMLKGAGRSPDFDIRGGSLALSGVSITGGRANRGGGIRNEGGTLQLTDVVIRNNSARRSGGGLFNTGMATLSNVVFRGNHARAGANLANIGTLSLTDVTVPGESARFGPGPFGSLGTVRDGRRRRHAGEVRMPL
jgi:hypothetical protein